MTNKTLIGKNSCLFLYNDGARELEVHCNNVNLVKDKKLQRYTFKNFMLVVFPNKSLIYKDLLPEKYKVQFRPALDDYIKVLNTKIIDTYGVLKNEKDVYYKTDTHINFKGAYIVYKYFLKQLNEIYNLNVIPIETTHSLKTCILSDLQLGIGDLLWETNLGDQYVEDHTDNFYYSDDIEYIYCKHKIQENDKLRILSKDLNDETNKLIGRNVSWEILSTYILHKKNICKNKLKVLIFYDSFLTSSLSLYLDLFEEVYMVKEIYNNNIINTKNQILFLNLELKDF